MDNGTVNLTKNEDKPKEEQGALSHLETITEYQERWASIKIIYFTFFLMALGFSIVITGVWPYLRKLEPDATKEFMGYIVAAHPFAQMIFSPLIGWWGNRMKKIQIPLIITMVIFIIASATYSVVEIFPSYRKYWMLSARFFIGASSANTALCRSYISSATKLEERTRAVSMISLAQVLGFIVGPGLQAAVTPLGVNGVTLIPGKLSLNMYTAAGLINVVFGVVNLVLITPFFFKEKSIAAKEAMLLSSAPSEKAAWKQIKPDYLSAWTMIIAFFILTFNFVLLESLGTTLTMDQFAWTDGQALSYLGILLSFGSVVACIISAFIDRLCKRFGEIRVLMWGGFLLMVLGRAVYIPWGSEPAKIAYKLNATSNLTEKDRLGCPEEQEWCLYTPGMTVTQFVIGFLLTSLGYPIGITLIQTVFSKILGPRPQGVWMGLITGSGCLSRVVGPVFVVYIYTSLGTIWTFGLTTVMMLLAMVWLWLIYDRLQGACATTLKLHEPAMTTAKEEAEFIDLDGVGVE